MIRGSCFDRVQCDRNGHGVQSFRANRASKTTPFFGYVFGSQEMLSLPAQTQQSRYEGPFGPGRRA
jgi:hypothetical protein